MIGIGMIWVDHQSGAHPDTRIVVVARTAAPVISWVAAADAQPGTTAILVVEEVSGLDSTVLLRREVPASGELQLPLQLEPWHRYRAHVGAASILFEAPGDEVPASWIEVDRGRAVRLRYEACPGARHRLVVAAHAIVRPLLDGQPVCASTVIPTRTDLARSLYRVIDLDDGIPGMRELDLLLGVGEWGGLLAHPRVCAAVLINDRVIAATGAATVVISSGVIQDQPFILEALDHGAERAEIPDERPRPCIRNELGIRSERPDTTPPVAALEPLCAVELHRRDGVRVYRVPVNVAGRSRLIARGSLAAGTTLRVIHGEQLDDAGRVDTTNIALPVDRHPGRQIVEHHVRGIENEVLEGWFAYHGFCYLEVQGLPDDAQIEVLAVPIRSLIEPISELVIDDPAVHSLVTTATQTLYNNVHGLPEDCPTREQSGWTGDGASVSEFTFASHDVRNLFDKWLTDMATSQRADGSIPGVVPNLSGWQAPVDPVWGAALPRLLLQHWLNYGDAHVVADHLPTLGRWVDALRRWRGRDGVVSEAPFSFGHDWLALDLTPPELMHSVAALEALEVEARLLTDLGQLPDRAAMLRTEADLLRTATRRRFVHADGVANDSQGALAWAILGGLLSPEEEAAAARAIAADVEGRGARLSSGFAGTRGVVLALSRHHPGVLRAALDQRVSPGIGAMLASDVGTLWESWWHDPTNNGTGSLDHLGLAGPIAGWPWIGLAGVRPTAAGWAEFEVAPHLVATVQRVAWSRRTPRGVASLTLERRGTVVLLDIAVPPGSVALVGDDRLGAGRHMRELPLLIDDVPAPRVDDIHWTAPARIPSPRDAAGGRPLEWCDLDIEPGGLRCAPVSHGQLSGPAWTATARDAEGALCATARPTIITNGTGFLYAWLDICRADIPDVPIAELVARWADGSVTRSSTRAWHAGWTRATLQIDGSRGSLVDLTLRLVACAEARSEAAVLNVGPAGWSPGAPRW